MTPTRKSCSNDESEFSPLGAIAAGTQVDFNSPLARCKTCNHPVEKDIVIFNAKRRVRVICQCQKDELEQQAEADREKELRRRLDKFRAYSLMDDRFSESTFDNWTHRPDNAGIYTLGKRYCEKWDTMFAENQGLLLHGKAGCGKTYLSFAIANELYKKGKAVIAISVARILAAIKDSYSNHGDAGENDVLNTLREASLLILDDLGVEYKTAWAYEKLYAIIDIRYRANKPTIITTNLTLAELRENLAAVDAKSNQRDPSERILNRVTEMCVPYEVKGASLRVEKGKQKRVELFTQLGISGQ